MVCAVRADLCIGCGLCVTLGNPTAPQQREFGCPPDYDAIRLKKVDAYTSEAILGHAGKVFATARRTISEDGRLMTISFRADDLGGTRVNNVMVYDRSQ